MGDMATIRRKVGYGVLMGLTSLDLLKSGSSNTVKKSQFLISANTGNSRRHG